MKSSDVSKPNYAETLRRRKIDFKSYVLHTFEEGTLEELKRISPLQMKRKNLFNLYFCEREMF